MSYLKDKSDNGSFSLKDYFQGIENNSGAWLFLATKPSNRELTLPIISCLAELALSMLMEIGIDRKRRVWFVVDELSALGKLPALNTLMAEGRKYGACVLAATQSLNQIYSNYGHYDGSTIFGQFGTSFFFSNKEPAIGKMISAMCGTEVITKQQKNTSFGANEFRDGQSYTEHEKSKLLVEYSDLTKLSVGECYVLMPEPDVRLSKIQAPEILLSDKNKRFVPSTKKEQNSDKQKHEGLTETKKDDITEDSNNPIINNDILSKPEDDVQIKTKPDPSLEFAKDI
jgi:type IV secretory pathway TraG/TraD family ATPase VirD4